jgi:hypothetical protein
MAAITPSVGGGMVVQFKATAMKAATWRRERVAGELPIPTSGMTANADGNYEVPHATGLIRTRVVVTAPFNSASTFFSTTFDIRTGMTVAARFGMSSTLLTPSINYKVLSTTDMQDVEKLGEWECTLVPATDDTAGYFTEAS